MLAATTSDLRGTSSGMRRSRARLGEHGEFQSGYIAPASMFGRVVDFQAFGDGPGLFRPGCTIRAVATWLNESVIPGSTTLSASKRSAQRACPASGSLHASAIIGAHCLASSLGSAPGRGPSLSAHCRPPSTNRRRARERCVGVHAERIGVVDDQGALGGGAPCMDAADAGTRREEGAVHAAEIEAGQILHPMGASTSSGRTEVFDRRVNKAASPHRSAHCRPGR